jgi:RNA binding exosome subunit
LNIKESDLDYLINKFPDFIKEELKYYKQLDKQ